MATTSAPLYHCTNAACGAISSGDQVIRERFEKHEVLLCPKCRMGVEELVAQPTFGARVPGAFRYPFEGDGRWMMLTGAALLTFLDFASVFGIIIWLIVSIFVYGYFGNLLLDVVRTTATDEHRPLEWPELVGLGEMMGNAFQVVGSFSLVFAPAIVCWMYAANELHVNPNSTHGELLMTLALIVGLIGLLYYPMAFLALAMFDNLGSANPFLIVPAIYRAGTQYALVLLLLVGLYLVRVVVGTMTSVMVWWLKLALILPIEFLVLYTLVVSARLLGLLYRSNEQNFGWFRR